MIQPAFRACLAGLRDDATCVMTSLAFTGLFWRKLKQIPKQKKTRQVTGGAIAVTTPVSVSPIQDWFTHTLA